MRLNRGLIVLASLLLGLMIGVGATLVMRGPTWFGSGPEPVSIATASLQSLQEQSRLTPFTARFVAVVTSSQTRFGLRAQKTLIMPGTVRYELDLTKLRERDLVWDAGTSTLTVTLPPIELSAPQVALDELREYGGGGVLAVLTDADEQIQRANRQRGQQELVKQAGAAVPLRLARDAAKRAIERSFVMPLRAAGMEAKVVARFGDEPSGEPSFLDRSRSIEDVYRNTSG